METNWPLKNKYRPRGKNADYYAKRWSHPSSSTAAPKKRMKVGKKPGVVVKRGDPWLLTWIDGMRPHYRRVVR